MEKKTKNNSQLNCVERWNVSFSHQLWTILFYSNMISKTFLVNTVRILILSKDNLGNAEGNTMW